MFKLLQHDTLQYCIFSTVNVYNVAQNCCNAWFDPSGTIQIEYNCEQFVYYYNNTLNLKQCNEIYDTENDVLSYNRN